MFFLTHHPIFFHLNAILGLITGIVLGKFCSAVERSMRLSCSGPLDGVLVWILAKAKPDNFRKQEWWKREGTTPKKGILMSRLWIWVIGVQSSSECCVKWPLNCPLCMKHPKQYKSNHIATPAWSSNRVPLYLEQKPARTQLPCAPVLARHRPHCLPLQVWLPGSIRPGLHSVPGTAELLPSSGQVSHLLHLESCVFTLRAPRYHSDVRSEAPSPSVQASYSKTLLPSLHGMSHTLKDYLIYLFLSLNIYYLFPVSKTPPNVSSVGVRTLHVLFHCYIPSALEFLSHKSSINIWHMTN